MNEDEALLLQRQLRRFLRRQRAERPQIDGVSSRAVAALGAIARAGGTLQPGELAVELDMAPPNVAAALRELEVAGLVVRDRHPDDGRRVSISLTAAGDTTVAANRASRAEWLRTAAESTLTPAELRQLLHAGELLERVATWQGRAG